MSKVFRIAPWAAVALFVVALVICRGWTYLMLNNADLLSPAALYQDVAVDGYPFANYVFSAATFAVPDQVVYFSARAVTGDHITAMVVWVVGLFVLLTAAGTWLSVELVPDRRPQAVTVTVALAVAYMGWNAAHQFAPPHADLLFPVCHNGALTLTLAGLAACLRMVQSGRWWSTAGWAVAAGVIAAVAVFSDRLSGPYLTVPAVAGLVYGWLTRWVRGRRLILGVAALGVGTLFGLQLLKWFLGANDSIDSYWTDANFEKLSRELPKLLDAWWGGVQNGNPLILGAGSWFAFAPLVWWRGRRRSRYLWVVSTTCLVVVTALYLLSDATKEGYVPRYFFGPLGLPFAGWAVWLSEGRTRWLAAPLVAVGMAGWGAVASFNSPPCDIQTERVREIDRVCRENGLVEGVGGYSDGKPCTLFSETGLTLRQVHPSPAAPCGFDAFPWLGNLDWYTRRPDGQPASFQFVLAAPDGTVPANDGWFVTESIVVNKLGPPAKRLTASDRVILVYDREEDWRLRRFGELDHALLNERFSRNPTAELIYPGVSFHSPQEMAGKYVESPDSLTREAVEGVTPTGYLAQGPYLKLPMGKYKVTFRISAIGVGEDPVGTTEVVLLRENHQKVEVLSSEFVRPGVDQEVKHQVRIRRVQAGGVIEFRTRYAGNGRLTLHDVRIEKLPK